MNANKYDFIDLRVQARRQIFHRPFPGISQLLVFIFPLICSVIFFAAPCIAEDDQAATKLKAEQAVEHSLQRMIDAYQKRDADLLTSPDIYYSDDSSPSHYVLFDVMPPFMDVGFKNLLEKNRQFMAAAQGPILIGWSDKYIDTDGEFAFFRGIMHVKMRYADGRNLDFALRHTIIFKRIGGKYLVVHEHASLPDASVGVATPHP